MLKSLVPLLINKMLLKSYEEDINKFHQGALTIIISWGVLQGEAVKHEKI